MSTFAQNDHPLYQIGVSTFCLLVSEHSLVWCCSKQHYTITSSSQGKQTRILIDLLQIQPDDGQPAGRRSVRPSREKLGIASARTGSWWLDDIGTECNLNVTKDISSNTALRHNSLSNEMKGDQSSLYISNSTFRTFSSWSDNYSVAHSLQYSLYTVYSVQPTTVFYTCTFAMRQPSTCSYNNTCTVSSEHEVWKYTMHRSFS